MPSVATLTRVLPKGALAKKADIAEFNAMLKTARERVRKLFNEGKSEADVIAVRPLKELGAKWVASHEAAVATKMVYNSFKRSSPLVRRESRILTVRAAGR
jgi:cyclase